MDVLGSHAKQWRKRVSCTQEASQWQTTAGTNLFSPDPLSCTMIGFALSHGGGMGLLPAWEGRSLFLSSLTPQRYAGVSQGRMTGAHVATLRQAKQIKFAPTLPQYIDTGSATPCTNPMTQVVWLNSRSCTNFSVSFQVLHNMASQRSERPIRAPPRLSAVSPRLPSKQCQCCLVEHRSFPTSEGGMSAASFSHSFFLQAFNAVMLSQWYAHRLTHMGMPLPAKAGKIPVPPALEADSLPLGHRGDEGESR